MGRFTFWILVILGTSWVLWHYRRRLRIAMRILMVLYPAAMLLSLLQNGFDLDRLLLVLVLVAVAASIFIANRILAERASER